MPDTTDFLHSFSLPFNQRTQQYLVSVDNHHTYDWFCFGYSFRYKFPGTTN